MKFCACFKVKIGFGVLILSTICGWFVVAYFVRAVKAVDSATAQCKVRAIKPFKTVVFKNINQTNTLLYVVPLHLF